MMEPRQGRFFRVQAGQKVASLRVERFNAAHGLQDTCKASSKVQIHEDCVVLGAWPVHDLRRKMPFSRPSVDPTP